MPRRRLDLRPRPNCSRRFVICSRNNGEDERRPKTSGMLINLLVQIVAGAIGGNAAGAVKSLSLGTLGNTIAGAIGGAWVARFLRRSFRCLPTLEPLSM
jgi:uncharacterized membrane protein YeaQ/YmgE (transglycosylase-associated protein family)